MKPEMEVGGDRSGHCIRQPRQRAWERGVANARSHQQRDNARGALRLFEQGRSHGTFNEPQRVVAHGDRLSGLSPQLRR